MRAFSILLVSILFSQTSDIVPEPGHRYMIDARTGEKIEYLGEYDRVGEVYIADSIHVFMGEKAGKRKWIDLKTGKVLHGDYDRVGPVSRFGQRHIFTASDGEHWFYVDLVTGDIIGRKFDGIGEVMEFEDRYIARVVDQQMIYFLDLISGEVLSGPFDESGLPEYHENRYLVAARKGDRWVWHDLDKDEDIGGIFQSVGQVHELGGKSYFQALEDNEWFYVELSTGKQMPGRWESMSPLGRKLESGWAFRVLKDMKWYLVRDWDKGMQGPGFDYILDVRPVGGDLLIQYQEDDERYWTVMNDDGSTEGRWMDFIDPVETENGIFFKTLLPGEGRTEYAWINLNKREMIGEGKYDLSDLMLSPKGIIYTALGEEGWRVYGLNGPLTPAFEYIADRQIWFRDNTYFRASDGEEYFYINLESGEPVEDWGRWQETCCFSTDKAEFKVRKDGKFMTYSIDHKRIID